MYFVNTRRLPRGLCVIYIAFIRATNPFQRQLDIQRFSCNKLTLGTSTPHPMPMILWLYRLVWELFMVAKTSYRISEAGNVGKASMQHTTEKGLAWKHVFGIVGSEFEVLPTSILPSTTCDIGRARRRATRACLESRTFMLCSKPLPSRQPTSA